MSNGGKTTGSNSERKRKVRRGEPIECRGLIFYPILMAQYEEFLECQTALLLRMTSLPVQYMAMPLLAALWAMDIDSIKATGKIVGLFERVIHFLYLSLRLGYDRKDIIRTVKFDTSDIRKLTHIEVTQGGNTVQITPREFSVYFRPLMAEQNGLTLPDESMTPELVKAEQDLQRLHALPVNYDVDTLIASVAYQSLVNEREIDDWTVYQFDRRRNAIDRDKHFMLFGQAEMSGMVKFKKGNPYRSWCFDPVQGITPALRTASDVTQNVKAVGDVTAAVQASRGQTQTQKS